MISNYRLIMADGEVMSLKSWKEYLDNKWLKKEIDTNEKKEISHFMWEHNNQSYKIIFEKKFPDLLPDNSGLMIKEKDNEIVVYNPDLKERFKVFSPLGKCAKENSYFYYARFTKSGGCEILFFDGFGDSVGDLNLITGEITNIRETRV